MFRQTVLGLLEPLQPLLGDDSINEIMINTFEEIYIERCGRLERTQHRFASEQALAAAVRNIAQYVGGSIDAARPILDARLPDGSRVCAILPPASSRGICASIRRFSVLTPEHLLVSGALTAECRDFLRACVLRKRNLLVAGGVGSGKTSLLRVLSSFIPDSERIVVIEEASELRLDKPHVVYLEARPPGARGEGAVSVGDLLRASSHLRPDRIIVGECRSGEALDLVQAMGAGYGGCLSSFQARHPRHALDRLEALCLMGRVELPLAALRAQIASVAPVLVQTSRTSTGVRNLTHVAECCGLSPDGRYLLRVLFKRKADMSAGSAPGREASQVAVSSEPSGTEAVDGSRAREAGRST